MVARATSPVADEVRLSVEDSDEDKPSTGESEDTASPTVGTIGIDFTVSEYLTQRRVKHSVSDDRALLRCPACKSRTRTLAVNNDLGSFLCSSCSRRGVFSDLRRLLGDKSPITVEAPAGLQFEILVPQFESIRYHHNYEKNLRADGCNWMAWLTELGIKDDLIKKLHVGHSIDFDALVFPYLYSRKKGSTSYLRFLRPPEDWWKAKGDTRTSSWFGQQLFKIGVDTATIAQTPLDALALLSLGEPNVLAPPLNTSDYHCRTHQLALLQKCSLIHVVPNPTDEGMRWALKMQAEIGRWRTKIVQLDVPTKEIASEAYSGRWASAKTKAVSTVGVQVRDAKGWLSDLDNLYEDPAGLRGSPTQLEGLDELLGGWRPGEVTVLSGEPGIGKSTFAAYLSLLQASEGRPALHVSFEVLPSAIVRKWVQMLAGDEFQTLPRGEYVAMRRKLARRPLHLPSVYGVVELPEVRRAVYDSVTRHGIRLVVLDHLGFMSVMGDATNDIRATGLMMREIKRWSLDLGIHILVLHHLRKSAATSKRTGRDLEDLRGSAEVSQLADNVIFVTRKRGETRTVVDLKKVRDDAGFEGKVAFEFERKSLRYLPV